MEYLDRIIEAKQLKINNYIESLDELMEKIEKLPKRPSFKEALSKKGLAIIGEIKKASPSKGLIQGDFRYMDFAKEYEMCVDAISVLTEEDFFLGSESYLEAIAKEVNIPVLYKDFIIDPIQIYRAKAIGASAVLLIVRILSDEALSNYHQLAKRLGLDTLVETHNEEEVMRSIACGCDIIGINHRNLSTFETDLTLSERLVPLIPKGTLIIGESAIFTGDDTAYLMKQGVDAILVGEAFMRSEDKIGKARELRGEK